MTYSWLLLSTSWDLSSIQAALNVLISVLSTIILWAWSRFWWQRVSARVVHKDSGVPLPQLLLVTGPGEGWDVVTVLGRRLFTRGNWPLLTQTFVVLCITLASALSGPIAKGALRHGSTTLQKDRLVLQAVKGDGGTGSTLGATVLWNQTGSALDIAGFPLTQLLDKLPLSSPDPWIYAETEWDPTWTLHCNYTSNVNLPNVTASGDSPMRQPLAAFPAFNKTYSGAWLDSSEYRFSTGFTGLVNWTEHKWSEALFFVLVQSNPEVHDRMDHNNETLTLSITLFHAQNFSCASNDTTATSGGSDWIPVGAVERASYSRAECFITRKASVPDENRIPWPWTNDTMEIIGSYESWYYTPFQAPGSMQRTIETPTAESLIRFYQIYMATTNTYYSDPTTTALSSRVQTVELSLPFLVVAVLLAVLTMWAAIRYQLFVRQHKTKIKEISVPDGKVDWIIHAAKISHHNSGNLSSKEKRHNDLEYLQNAMFGRRIAANSALSQIEPEDSKFARVLQSPRILVAAISPNRSFSGSHPTSLDHESGQESDHSGETAVPGHAPFSTVSEGRPLSRDLVCDDTNPAEALGGELPSMAVHGTDLPLVQMSGGEETRSPKSEQNGKPDRTEEHEVEVRSSLEVKQVSRNPQ
ncbi:hypothetical protein PFICI_13444 [Pestalotiopsis fici W106-1]|uniref:Uncharacterized protein n=1 Tax=Pestalotiopsis fici (strain W106-1 / CGMCC3.15140) TaxID=1229662 RepID=W3WM07_PESFW|nr:uncharacterized protein PFICI_13444 [Pestalotiopsis fici W106-1]ETS74960.1 hypothetical protein PFICI_13444 [Pestalotiopsis fici W106-1]